jgi:hypothetical protein
MKEEKDNYYMEESKKDSNKSGKKSFKHEDDEYSHYVD